MSQNKEDIEALQHEFIESAATLCAVQKIYGDKVQEQSKSAYRRLIDAHLLITGVLAAGLLRTAGKIVPFKRINEERNSLFASYIIGMAVCERAINEGRYLQAQALLRQEMETLAQLRAVSAGKRDEKRPPNLNVLEDSIKRLYGDLSAAAHVSKRCIVRSATEFEFSDEDLPGPISGTRYFPVFIEEVARRSFSLHLILSLCLIKEMSTGLDEQYGEEIFSARETCSSPQLNRTRMH